MLTATGIGSGLDIESLVSQLVASERAPVESRLVNRESVLTAELSGFGSLKSALSTFQSSLSSLNSLATFGRNTTSSSDAGAVSVSATGDAAPGSYSVAVTQLAKAHSLASGSYGSDSEALGTGTITIRFGTTDYVSPVPGPESYNSFAVNPDKGAATLTIDSSNNTLAGLRDAINDAEIGVNAVIVNDGTGYRLLLASNETGAENSLEISVSGDGDSNDLDNSGLSALSFNSNTTHLSQTLAAQDALFTVNGLSVSSSSNTADDVLEGLSISLKEETDGIPVTLSVSEDHKSVRTAIESFVNGYNQFIATFNSLTSYDAETGKAGPLQGDFSARSIASQVRQMIGSAVDGAGGAFSSLSELGVTTKEDGGLAIDSTRLENQLTNHFDDVVSLFAAIARPVDDNIGYINSSSATVVGNYDVNITQMATRGQLSGTVTSFPLIIDADNDEFSVRINGVASGILSITQGSYASGDALAAELQARINGDQTLKGNGFAVTVSFNSDHFEIVSERYGASSAVQILTVDTNTTAQLGLSVGSGSSGLDVAGTIGGVAATGSGQFLTGALGADAEGLKLLIDGGSVGSRGVVSFSRGVANQLNSLITTFLGTNGVFTSRTDGIESRIEDIKDQRDVLNRRMEALELRYRSQFNALDSLLAQLQTTSDFLTQQLASLPGSGQLLNKS